MPSPFSFKENPIAQSNIGSPGTLLRLFAQRKELLDGKKIKFRAKGYCMYPSIRPKDLLLIEYRQCRQIQVGQVAVYRRENNLFGHRVVEKGSFGQEECIFTRSDVSRGKREGPIFDRDIAGVITGILRKGRRLSCARIRGNLFQRVFLKGLSALYKIRKFLKKGRLNYLL